MWVARSAQQHFSLSKGNEIGERHRELLPAAAELRSKQKSGDAVCHLKGVCAVFGSYAIGCLSLAHIGMKYMYKMRTLPYVADADKVELTALVNKK